MITNIINGLQILQRYFDKPNGPHAWTDGGDLMVGVTDFPLSERDVHLLNALGWTQYCDDDLYRSDWMWAIALIGP